MSLLQARGITKSFGSRLILDGLDLDVEPGVRMGVIGPNGGGKSTMLRILAGEETADAGSVTQRRGLVLAFLRSSSKATHATRSRRCAPRVPTSTSWRPSSHGSSRSSATSGPTSTVWRGSSAVRRS